MKNEYTMCTQKAYQDAAITTAPESSLVPHPRQFHPHSLENPLSIDLPVPPVPQCHFTSVRDSVSNLYLILSAVI